MKNKFTAIVSITVCFLMVMSVMTACSFKKGGDDDTTTLEPNPQWQQGADGTYEPVDISDVELVGIVSEALGDEAKNFDGDLNKLTDEQIEKVKEVAEKKGYTVETDSNNDTVIKKDPSVQVTEAGKEDVSEIYSKADVKESGTVNDEQYKEISSAAADKGAEAVTDKKGNVTIVYTTKVTTTAAPTTAINQNGTTAKATTTAAVEIPSSTDKITTYGTTKRNNVTTTVKYTGETFQTVAYKIGAVKADGGNTYGTGAHCLFSGNTATSDGVISVGNSSKKSGVTNGVIVKNDTSGKKVWEDTLSADDIVKFNDVVTLSDGSVVVVGETLAEELNTDSGYKCKGTVEGVIIKYNANGKKLWTKLIGGSGADMIYAVATTPDGGFVIAGETESKDADFKGTTQYENNGFVAKCDSNGNIIWKKAMGGEKNCAIKDVCVTSSGTVYTVAEVITKDGDFAKLDHPSANKKYTVVCKYKADGTREWVKSFYDLGNVTLSNITAANDNGCVIAGSYTAGKTSNEGSFKGIYNGGPAGTSDGMVVKINSTGDVAWRTPLIGFENDLVTGITAVNGGYAITGYSTSTNRDFAFGNNGDYDSFVGVISNGGKLGVMTGFGGSESDRAQAICSNGNTVYSSGTSLSSDHSFANFGYKSDGTNAMAFAMKFNLVEAN